jgi:hypothetical protein
LNTGSFGGRDTPQGANPAECFRAEKDNKIKTAHRKTEKTIINMEKTCNKISQNPYLCHSVIYAGKKKCS